MTYKVQFDIDLEHDLSALFYSELLLVERIRVLKGQGHNEDDPTTKVYIASLKTIKDLRIRLQQAQETLSRPKLLKEKYERTVKESEK